jgi:hypothetical protein
MSSLWTPEGEHRVSRDDRPGKEAPPARPGAAATPEDDAALEQAYREEMAALEAELLTAPVEAVIANHCYGLFQLAALHLGQRPPHLREARLAIDALGAVVEGLGESLGEGAPTLREGLAQLRLAFVQIANAPDAAPTFAPDGGEAAPEADSEDDVRAE